MRFTALLQFQNLNPRREKAGDGPGALAADLKLKGDIPIADLRPLFGSDHGYALLTGLFDANGSRLAEDIGALVLSSDLQSYRVQLSVGKVKLKFDGADLNQIRVEPSVNNTAKLALRVQLHPTEEQFAALAELLSSKIKMTVEEVQGSLFAAGPPSEEEEEEEEEEPTGDKRDGKGGKSLLQ